MIDNGEHDRVFEEAYLEYPTEFQWPLTANDARMRWQVKIVLEKVPVGGALLDIDAGLVPVMYIFQKIWITRL